MAAAAANRPKRAPFQRKGPLRQLITRITGRPLDLFEGRRIRKDENGKEFLDDYFPEPVKKGDESDISGLSNLSIETSIVSPEKPIERPKRLPFLLGSRTGKILFPPGKVFRRNSKGKEDIKDYFPSEESESDLSDASGDANNSKPEKLPPELAQNDSKTSSRSHASRLSKADPSSVNINSSQQGRELRSSSRPSLVPGTPKISNTTGGSNVSQVSPRNVIVHQPKAMSPLPGINVSQAGTSRGGPVEISNSKPQGGSGNVKACGDFLMDMRSKHRTRLSFGSPTNTQQDQTTPTKTQNSPQNRITPTKRSALHESVIPYPDPSLLSGSANPTCDDDDDDDDAAAEFFSNFRLIRRSVPAEGSKSANVVANPAERDPSSVPKPAKTSIPSENVSVGSVAAAIRAASTRTFESRSASISTSPRPNVHSSTRNDEHGRSLNITFDTSRGPNVSAILQKEARRSTRTATLAEASRLERTAIVSPNQGRKIHTEEDKPSVIRTRSSSRNNVRSSRKTPAQVSGVRTTSTRKTRSSTASASIDLIGGIEMEIEEAEATNVDQFSTTHVEVPKESRPDRFASSSVHHDINKSRSFSSAARASIAGPTESYKKPYGTVTKPNNLTKSKEALTPHDVKVLIESTPTSVWKPTRQPLADSTSGPITRATTSSSRTVESTTKEKRSPAALSKKNKKPSSVSFSGSGTRRMIIGSYETSSEEEEDEENEEQQKHQQHEDQVEPVREVKSPVRLGRSSTSTQAREQPSTSTPIDQSSLLFDQMLAAKGRRTTPQPSVVMPPPLPARTSKRVSESSSVIDTSDHSRMKSRRLTRPSQEPLLLDIHEDDDAESSTIWGRRTFSGVNSKGNKHTSNASSGSSRILTDEDVQDKEKKNKKRTTMTKTKRHVSRVVIEDEEEEVQEKEKTKRKTRSTSSRIMSNDDEEILESKRKSRTRKSKQPHKQDFSRTEEATSATDSDVDPRFFDSEESYEQAKELWKKGFGKVNAARSTFVDPDFSLSWKKKKLPTKGKSVREESTNPEEESADSDLSEQSSSRQPSNIPKRRVTHKRKMKYSTSVDETEMTLHNSTTVDYTETDELSGPIERPKRQRFKRLEYWRGERIIYQANSNGGHSILEIDPGLDPALSEISIPNRANREYKKREPKRDPANEEEPEVHVDEAALAEDGFKMSPDGGVYVINPLTGEETFVACFQAKDSHYAFTVSGEMAGPEDEIIFTKPIRQLTFSAGTIELKPKVEKGLHHLRNDTMGFFVIQGVLEVTIHDTRIIAKKGDMFFVPQGNKYNLRNGSDFVVKLHFFQLKHELPECA